MRRIKHDKIHEALELLNEAAKGKQDELYEAIDEKYEHLKDFVVSKADNGVHFANLAKRRFAKSLQAEEEKIRDKAKEIDKRVHQNPWPFVGAATLSALLVGIIVGKK